MFFLTHALSPFFFFALALVQIASVSASPLPAPQALPLNLVSNLAGSSGPAIGSASSSLSNTNTNTNNNANNNAIPLAGALLSPAAPPNTNTANTPTDNVKHTASSSSPLDLESLPLLGTLDSAVPQAEGEGGAASTQAQTGSSGAPHPSGPLSLLGRRAFYSVYPRASAGSTSVPVSTNGGVLEGEEGTTKTKLGRAERFKARLMRRASLGSS